MKTIKSCLLFLLAATATAFTPAFAETVKDAKWGNVGNATDGGVATKADSGNYSNVWTLDFGDTNGVCTTGIGANGVVQIRQIRMAKRKAPNDATQTPSVVYLEQDDEKVASTNLEIVTGGISAYAQDGSVVTDGTRDAYVFTFGVDATFDTSKSIVLSFDVNNAGLGMMQPANPTFQYKSYSPIIEITGDYSPNGSMKQELQHHYSFDGTTEATSGQPLTFNGGQSVSYVDSGHGQAYKISDSACPYGTGILQCGEECWTIATFAKLVKTDNAVAWASGRHSDNTGYVALTTGTGGRVQVVKSMSSTAMAAQTLITSSITVDDCAEKYHLFTVTRNNNFLKLYVDGNLVGTYQGSVQLPDARFQLGRVRGSLDNTGLVAGNDICLDEWRLYQGDLSADEVKDLAEEFPVWPQEVTMPESVSINFIGGSSNKTYPNGMKIADTDVAGVVEIAGAQWNQIIDKGGTVISTNDIPLKEVLKDGSTLTGVMTADVQAKCTWNALGNSTPVSGNGQMMYGYLDDGETSGGYGARITVNDIPYSEYTVYVYMGADDEQGEYFAKQFLSVYVNDVGYPSGLSYWGYWGYASATHENGSPLTLTEQNNYLKISGVTGSVLRIVGSTASYYDRCGIAGIQIVNTGTRAATGGDYVANITAANATWGNGTGTGLEKMSSGAWENDNTAAITLTNLTDAATLTFDTDVTAAKVNIVQAASKSLTLKATAETEVGKYDFSKNAGTVSVGTDLLGESCALSGNNAKIIPGGTVDFALGENGMMSVSGDGSANNANIKYTLSSGTLTIVTGGGKTGPFNKSAFTACGSNVVLKLAVTDATGYGAMNNPAFTFEDGAEMQVFKRDTQTTPVVLKSSTVRMMNGCGGDGRGFELFNSNGNNWTVEGASGFVLDPTIGEAGKRVWLHQGDWNVEVKADGRFDVDVILYGANKVCKTGAGDMYLNGVNEYTGGTVIGEGKVYAGNAKALGTGTVKIEEGGTLVFYLDDFATITGAVKPFDFADEDSQARVEAIPSASHPEITYDPTTGKVQLDTSKSGVTGLHISSINPKPKGFDPNGHESSVVYLTNYGPDPVNLKDYKLVRTNFGKKVKPTDADILPLLEHEIAADDTYAVYLSEDYETASDLGGDGKTVKWFGSAMVVPTKVNPKKYPMVRLYDAAGSAVIDEVIVPCEIDDDITVEVGLNTNKLVRYVVNGTTRTEIGPDANGPYGVKDLENDIELMNGRGGFVSTTNGFTVILPVNPLKTGDAVLEPNKIKSVTLEYRFFDKDKMSSAFAEMTKLKKGDAGYDKNYGDQWSATIPQAELVGKEGKLLQYRAIITDNGGATWTAPRFCHPELGYEWYGAAVDPGETARTENLPTMLMFADSVNLVQMDKDVDSQDKSQVPYNARIAIYDTSTHRYYDNVRIDLRGNTSANFKKKSHGLRFSKVAPFTTTNPLDGKKWEVRKSSFCTEYADPTYIRQSLSFWLLNKVGSPAPFHYPVRLYLNGAFYQLAFHTERFTDELIEDVYGLNKFVYSYKNIGTFGGGTTAGGIEKKTPDDDNEKDLSVLNAYMNRYKAAASKAVTSMTVQERAALTKNVVTNFDLSAWVNYLAVAKITHENDDIWANLSGYIDKYDALHNKDGNDLMHPLAYDMNLSWGQWYYGDDSSAGRCGVRPADDPFKSHPLYGGMTIRAHKVSGAEVGNGNRAVEAVWQNDKFRRLYLRRLRTLMDEWLKEPGTQKEDTPFWTQYVVPFKALITASGKDVDEDRTKWNYANVTSSAGAIWVWDHALTLDEGYDDLWNNYVEPRRQHLYGKHSITNDALETGYATNCKAGIPAKQSAIADLKAKIGYELVDGGIKITNANGETVDISGWTLGGPFIVTIPNGTVLDENGGEVYFVTNRIAWCASHAAEIVDQFVVGNVKAGKPEADVSLIATDGTDIFYVPPTNQEHLRFYEIYGNTQDGAKGDTGEYFVLTNVSSELTVSLKGLQIFIGKSEDCEAGGPEAAKMKLVLAEGEVGPNGYAMFLQSDYTKGDGWEKITNGDLYLLLRSSAGVNAQEGYTSNKLYPECDGGGASLIAKTFGTTIQATTDDWRSSFEEPEPPTPPPGPGGDVISGDFPDGTNIVLTAAVTIRIGNATFGKAIAISGADATIELQAGTTATAPAITATGALTFDGAGTLSLSNDVALITATGLVVSNGVLKLDLQNGAAKKSAVYLKGDFKQFGGAVSLNLASDNTVYGIQIDKKDKEAYFEGGTFSAVVNAGEKSAAIKLEKGSSHANLKGGTTTVTMSGPTNRFVNTEGKIKISGGYAATVTSSGIGARVFKSVKEITIAGDAVVKVTASGDGSEAFSTDDSIKMSGGVVAATAADDCFSAQTNIVISAGKVQALSTAGDAIDSNGSMTISGGYVLAYALSPGCEALDVDPKDGADDGRTHKLVLAGGSVVAVGYEGMIHLPDAGSVACYTNGSVKYDKKYVEVAGTNDAHKTILSVNLNKKCAKKFSLVATCPGFIGTVSYTDTKPDKDKSYIDKLDENIDGAFLTTLDIVKPGKDKEMEAKTEEEAQEEIKKYEVQLTEEDRKAGVPKEALKMEAVAVTNGTGEVTGYKAVVALNPEVVEEPSVGEGEGVEPLVITPGEGGTEVSVGIVNATKGLWYGYEVCNALGEGFANDVPSFKRATDEAITVTGSKREGASSFFRVKVLPAQPAK